MAADMTARDRDGHVRDLDAFRGIAILGVVAYHARLTLSIDSIRLPLLHTDLTRLIDLGRFGPFLFFILSGFLLTNTETRCRLGGTYSVRSYARRRVLRLAPAYYLSLVVYFVLNGRFGTPLYQPPIAPALDFASYFTFLHALFPLGWGINAAYWSLTPEVAFYAALPLLLRYAFHPSARILLYMCSLAACLYTIHLSTNTADRNFQILLFCSPAATMHMFFAGSLLATLMSKRTTGIRSTVLPWVGNAAVVAVIAGTLLITYNAFPVPSTFAFTVLAQLIISIMVVLFFVSWILGSSGIKLILRLPGLVFTGRISYSVFLFHQLVLNCTVAIGLTRMLRSYDAQYGHGLILFGAYLSIVLCWTLALSALIYKYVEVPGMRGFRARRQLPTSRLQEQAIAS